MSIYEKMSECTPAEKEYKNWFEKVCYEAFPPAESWARFKEMYEDAAKKKGISAFLPELPPSYIGGSLSEEEWFNANEQVSVFRHGRWTPAFLHRLQFIKIIYVMSGSCRVFDRSGELASMTAGNVCIVLPDIEHALFCGGENDIIVNILMRRSTFETAFFSLLAEQGTVSAFFWEMLYKADSSRMLMVKGKKNGQIQNLVLELYAEANFEERRSRLIINSWICLLLGQLQRVYAEDIIRLDERSEKSGRILEILKYIAENLRYATLVSTSKHFCMSEGYMSRYIARETGLTFKQLLRKLRLERAARLLENSGCTAEEAADAVGYTNISRFYRNFKEFYGQTPGQYKKVIKSK